MKDLNWYHIPRLTELVGVTVQLSLGDRKTQRSLSRNKARSVEPMHNSVIATNQPKAFFKDHQSILVSCSLLQFLDPKAVIIIGFGTVNTIGHQGFFWLSFIKLPTWFHQSRWTVIHRDTLSTEDKTYKLPYIHCLYRSNQPPVSVHFYHTPTDGGGSLYGIIQVGASQ